MSTIGQTVTRSRLLRIPRLAVSRAIRAGNRALARPAIWIAAIAVLLALQLALIVTHRPWLDEYQAVQLAVEAPDIPTLLDWLRYEGHPPLWYLILRGLAHFMNPLMTLPVAAGAFAVITQGAILLRSPFTRCERLLIASSQFVLFEFLTLSRSMTMGAALLVVALALWRSRAGWIAIALLPMCDFLFGVISGILVILKWRDKRWSWAGAAGWIALGLAAAWSVRPAPDMVQALSLQGFGSDIANWLHNISTLALPFQGGIHPGWNMPPYPFHGILWAAFLWFAWTQSRGDRLHQALLFGFIALTFLFSITIYPLAIRHLMLIALLLILLTWLRRMAGERPDAAFRLWLAIASLCGLITGAINFAIPFDTADRAVAEIERLELGGKRWMVFPDSRAVGVAALSGIEFQRTELGCMQSFNRWNHRNGLLGPDSLARYLRAQVHDHGRFYLLSDLRFTTFSDQLLRPLATVSAGYDGQAFYLYAVGPAAAEQELSLPPCVAGRRPFAYLSK